MKPLKDTKDFILKSVEPDNRPTTIVSSYETNDSECVVGCSTATKFLQFLEIGSLVEINRVTTNKSTTLMAVSSFNSTSTNDPLIATVAKGSEVKIWNPVEGKQIGKLYLPVKEIRSISLFRGSKTVLAAGAKDGTIVLWDVIENVLIKHLRGHRGSVHCLQLYLNYEGEFNYKDKELPNDMSLLCLVSGSADRAIRSWDLEKGKKKKKFRHKRSITDLKVVNTGIRPLVVSGGVDMALYVWDIESGILCRRIECHKDVITSICVWEGNELLAITGSDDNTIQVFDIITGERFCILTAHEDAILDLTVAYKEDPILISSSQDDVLIEWSLMDIITHFYHQDSNNLGVRNDEPAIEPDFKYDILEGVDVEGLSKNDFKILKRNLLLKRREEKRKEREEAREREQQMQEQLRAASFTTSNKVVPIDETNPRAKSVQFVTNIFSKFIGTGSAATVTPRNHRGTTIIFEAAKSNLMSRYRVAAVSKDVEISVQKSTAQSKLKRRLEAKKVQSSKVNTVNTSDENTIEVDSVKQQKLMLHRAQDMRRNQSISMAKGRAKDALMRRLEEMAANKSILGDLGNDSSDDSDSN